MTVEVHRSSPIKIELFFRVVIIAQIVLLINLPATRANHIYRRAAREQPALIRHPARKRNQDSQNHVPTILSQVESRRFGCPRIARATSWDGLGTMPKNNLRSITLACSLSYLDKSLACSNKKNEQLHQFIIHIFTS